MGIQMVGDSEKITNQLFDVAVVGGGLAGLTLSIQLAKKGWSVLLFEKNRYPFHKVCGEYISMESWNFLERIGTPLSELNLPRINKLHVSSPNGKIISSHLNPGGFGISRYKLDSLLADIAVKNGVRIFDSTKVTSISFSENFHHITTTETHYKSKVVAGTYGKRSNLDKLLGRDFISKPKQSNTNFIGVKYHVEADLPSNLIELHNFEDGYCGISKIEDNRYCLCYLTTEKMLHKSGSDIKEMENKYLRKNPFLKNYFDNFPILYNQPLVISQISFEKKSLVEDHILMVGDSAGLITPLCGNGMSIAMNSALIASELTDQFLTGNITRNQLEMSYSLRWKSEFSNRLFAGRSLQKLFGNSHLTNLVIAGLKPFPKTVSKLIDLTHGNGF